MSHVVGFGLPCALDTAVDGVRLHLPEPCVLDSSPDPILPLVAAFRLREKDDKGCIACTRGTAKV